MTLMGAIIKRAQTYDELMEKKYSSPPPEREDVIKIINKKKKTKKVGNDMFKQIKAKVDTSPPLYDSSRLVRRLPTYHQNSINTWMDNIKLLMNIKKAHFERGKVDSRWSIKPKGNVLRYYSRQQLYKRLYKDNLQLYEALKNARPRVVTTSSLEHDWVRNRKEIIDKSQAKFVLFKPMPEEDVEDVAFLKPRGVKRTRLNITLRVVGASCLGTMQIELFNDVCPNTCKLFLDLMDGDGLGHGYVGTHFFRKVPHLYWTGGDVIYNNGFGCYAQKGRVVPIGAENYHFSHSMPGLLSMRVTKDDEMCGIFSITFKPLPQFDLKGVVFGRVIRPSSTYEVIKQFGNAVSTHPRVEISSAKRWLKTGWVCGKTNTRLLQRPKPFRKT